MAKHVLLNKVVRKTCTPSFGWRTVQMAFYATFTPICQGTQGWEMMLMSPEECFPSKGACPVLKEMSKLFVYLIHGGDILAERTVVAWYVAAVG